MKTLIFLTVIATMMANGCDKNFGDQENLPLIDGVYTGIFTQSSPSGTFTGNSTLIINENEFSASGNANRIPAGGSGSFSLSVNNQIISFVDQNFWTADFDWSLILSGEYKYSFDGEKLELSRRLGNGSTVQKYQLTKK